MRKFFLSDSDVLAALSVYEAIHDSIETQEAASQRELDETCEKYGEENDVL